MAPRPTPYKPLNKQKRPATDLQAKFRKQEEKDAKDMTKVRTQTSNTQVTGIRQDGSSALHEDHVYNLHDHELDDTNAPGFPHDNDNWEDVDEYEDFPINQLTEEQRQIISELNSNLYQSRRLAYEAKWASAVQAMVDAYIIARNQTSNWGDVVLWKHDFKVQCRATELRLSRYPVSGMLSWTTNVEKRLVKASATLTDLAKSNAKYSTTFFEQQWQRQRHIQLNFITATTCRLKERLTVLLALEEDLIEARTELANLEASTAPLRTQEQQQELLDLPGTLTSLENQIQNLANALGSHQFRELTGMTDNRAKPLMLLQIAKSKLYHAKVECIEIRARAEGTTGHSTKVKDLERDSKLSHLFSTAFGSKTKWLMSFKGIDPVTISLQFGMAKRACKLWISWKWGIEDVLLRTAAYLQLPDGFDHELLSNWNQLVTSCPEQWAHMIGMPNEIDDDDVDEGFLDVDLLEDLVENLQIVS
ncbi:uncharacterized protein MELLADRAFT_109383 [Melampsora larici-populina 98AG31]|uniref:Uncharacterized protein n=1 Tax=Melampsora larici-populina (strain 98AG31 / pathotype 3-4-7) TaxID=747676 RepID=F4RWA3_MELLP|nr:uncharacterized protein MELLADRAFT_109383 [Melampsora larici-populina 98AG31]EGG03357.1 hypothetical protein MELLADRAFT_109383 [Melampsora larici-populina 98AG31]